MSIKSAVLGIFNGENHYNETFDELTKVLEDRITLARITEGTLKGATKPKKVRARVKHAGLVYNPSLSTRYGSETYTQPEYDLASVANAIDMDSFFSRACSKYVELIWKNGYRFIGKNQNSVNYIKKRFEQISKTTDFPTEELFRQMSAQLVIYANVYISKVRDEEASGGSYRKTFDGLLRAPVAGYFVEDSVSMKLAVKQNGDPIGYKQMIPNTTKTKVWKPWNIIHMYYNRKPGLRVGTPLVWPVLDDIRALRKIEQNVELLVYQHTIPLYHYTVGTEESDAEPEEVAAVQADIQRMPPNGALVTSARHSIKVIGAEKQALEVKEYLVHFRSRIFAGLGMSDTGMGIGSTLNKATAQVMDKHMYNTTEAFHRVLRMFIDEYMIKELLAEGGFDTEEEDNLVSIYFPPVDKEVQYARENHYTQLYAQDAITEDELRIELGRDLINEETRMRMHFELIDKPTALINSIDESYTALAKEAQKAKTQVSKAKASSIHGKKAAQIKTKAAEKIGRERSQPSNQYGRQTTAPTIPKNDVMFDSVMGVFDSTEKETIEAIHDHFTSNEFKLTESRLKNTVFKLSRRSISDKMSEIDDSPRKRACARRINEVFDTIFRKVTPALRSDNHYGAINKAVSVFGTYRTILESTLTPKEEGE
jgi:hypothetical protein